MSVFGYRVFGFVGFTFLSTLSPRILYPSQVGLLDYLEHECNNSGLFHQILCSADDVAKMMMKLENMVDL